ncbi:MAG: 4-hydroxy-tetrahydrodipicolinate synthase [Alphaproteobacteria bacterium]|jgi:4-hydroxy-tetrahydrodipicolinate synthase|nr:4-hydroxy-tetrahydrodipicolinate synthase [Alphaproteobacteria bacterium]
MFEGSIPAVITPFGKNNEIDFESLDRHIEFLISEGSHGLVSCGTTGESPTLNHDEHKEVTEFIIKKSKGRVPVMAGCGSNSTKESIDFVHHAYKSGANGILLVTPYYNKPTQKGLYEHFNVIAKSCPEVPNYLYNIPGRSVVKIEIETIKKLSQIDNIVGVKDATADLTTPLEVKTNCKDNFQQLSGEDATFLSFLISGGNGCISVTANVVPRLSANIYNLWKSKKIDEAMSLNFKMYPLNNVLFLETSPSPVKYALSKMGKCQNILRKPMVPVEKETEKKIDNTLKDLNLVK